MQNDIIFIHGLKIQTIIGVYEWEKQFKQSLIFDLELTSDLSKAAQSDALNDTIDYKQISDEIIHLVEGNQYELIEAVGETVCQHIFEHHKAVDRIDLTLKKPNAVPQAQTVGIKITRYR